MQDIGKEIDMQIHEIPRNYKGEGRILYIFSRKGLIFTCIGAGIGLIFFFLFRMIGYTLAGVIITLILGLIGFGIGTFKMPESSAFEITKKTGGENIDDVIKRWIKFKRNGNRIYVYKDSTKKEKGDTKDAG